MTVKAEVECRQDADKPAVSKHYGSGALNAGMASADRPSNKLNKLALQGESALALPQFSARQVYLKVGLYGILLSSALWASVNGLNWIWHKLL
jgi:hypothetical protein